MEKFIRLLYAALVAVALSLALSACGDDEPEPDEPKPDEPEHVDPSVPTDDPVGTISLAMNNKANGGTELDGIFIGQDNNFGYKYDDGWYSASFCDLGKVAGLGNITTIPTTGWARNVQVIPGHGYIAIRSDRWSGDNWNVKQIYRIYVLDWIGSAEGGIMGANIKYQTPFDGADVALTLDKTSVVLSMDNPTAEVKITNSIFVPFDFESEGPFKVVQNFASGTNCITESLTIKCENEESLLSPEGASGIIKLTTFSGKTTEISVTRQAARPFITLEDEQLLIDCFGLRYMTSGFTTNITDDITSSTDEDWIKTEVSKDRYSKDRYELRVITSSNCSTKSRTGYVTLKSGSTAQRIKVTQEGFATLPDIEPVIESGPESGAMEIIHYDSSVQSPFLQCDALTVSKDFNWASIYSRGSKSLEISFEQNNTGSTREGNVKLYYYQNGLFDDILVATFTVRQLPD